MFIALSRKHNIQMEDTNCFTRLNCLVIAGCLRLSVSCSERAMCRSHNVLNISVFVYKIAYYFTELKSLPEAIAWMTVPRGRLDPLCRLLSICAPKGYGFLAVLVINRVSSLAMLFYFWFFFPVL